MPAPIVFANANASSLNGAVMLRPAMRPPSNASAISSNVSNEAIVYAALMPLLRNRGLWIDGERLFSGKPAPALGQDNEKIVMEFLK